MQGFLKKSGVDLAGWIRWLATPLLKKQMKIEKIVNILAELDW